MFLKKFIDSCLHGSFLGSLLVTSIGSFGKPVPSVQRQELNENLEAVTKMIDHTFRSVRMRYNDVVPEIRAVCMAELGTCLFRLPQQFLDDSHLKYWLELER